MKETDQSGNFKIKQFHQNYGFDLGKALNTHPIKELANEQDKIALLHSLQKGNRQAVTFYVDGKDQKKFIEANPQFKSITVYDSHMQRAITHSQKEKTSSEQSVKQDPKTKSQKTSKDDAGDNPKASEKKYRRKSQSIS
jgi:hypothetical protein